MTPEQGQQFARVISCIDKTMQFMEKILRLSDREIVAVIRALHFMIGKFENRPDKQGPEEAPGVTAIVKMELGIFDEETSARKPS